jgi:hypothetical protein
MLRKALVGLAAAVLLSATFVPSDAHAYRGGGRAHVGPRAGAVAGHGMAYRGPAYRTAYRGRYHPYTGVPIGAAAGAAALGAATVGAAAAGAYGSGYYNRGCVRNAYGYWECPQY